MLKVAVAFGTAATLVGCGNGYKPAVEALLPGATRVEYVNVKKYQGGAVCGMVRTNSASHRFMVGPNGRAYVEDNTAVGFKVYNMTEPTICRDL